MGQYDKSVTYHQASLKIDREIGNRRGEAADLGNLGLIYRAQKQYDRAIDHHRQALDIAHEMGEPRMEARQIANVGIVYRDLGRWDMAIEHLESGLRIQRELGDRQAESNQLGNLGTVYQRMGNYGRAASYHQQALAVSRDSGEVDAQRRHLGNLGIVYAEGLANYTLAHMYLAEAIDLTERLRGNLVEEAFRASYFRQRLYLHQAMVKVCLRLGRGVDAWQFVERARSRLFLDGLGLTPLMMPAGVGADQHTRENALSTDLRIRESQLSGITNDTMRNQIMQEIAALQDELEALWIKIEDIAPEYVSLRRGKPASWPEMRALL